jgi:hypothetical protein
MNQTSMEGIPPSQDIQKIIYQLLSMISLVENKTHISEVQRRQLQHWRRKLSVIRNRYNLNI